MQYHSFLCIACHFISTYGLSDLQDPVFNEYSKLNFYQIFKPIYFCPQVEPSKLTHAILVNNAGSLGDVSKSIKDLSKSAVSLQDYFNLNLTSPMFLM